nr:TnsA endonuclease N-terminal domain-containing protein [uncultured Halomonas sp.]
MGSPVRIIGTNRRSLTGQVAFRRGRARTFESSLERDFFLLLDFSSSVVDVEEQPLTIRFVNKHGQRRQYTPDVLVTYEDGKPPVLYEVKYREDLRANWAALKPKFQAALRYCRERDWHFRIVTEREIRGTCMLNNVRFLRAYRDYPRNEITNATATHLARTLAMLGEATPQMLLTAAYACEEKRMSALGVLWYMVANGRVLTNPLHPLTMASPLWITTGEGFLWTQDPGPFIPILRVEDIQRRSHS